MQNTTNNIPTTKPQDSLLGNTKAFLALALSSAIIHSIANDLANPFSVVNLFFLVFSSFSALGFAHYSLPDRSKLSVIVRGIPIVFPLSCMLFIMCNRIQNQAHKELIPLNFLGGFYLFSWIPYFMAIYAFRPIFKGFLPKFFK